LEEDESTMQSNTNANSPRTSKPASPSSQNFTVSAHQILASENDGGYRVNFSNAASDNQINAAYQKNHSVDVRDEPEAGQPLLKS
jgi:histone deacetylase complex regulatory component SIN3